MKFRKAATIFLATLVVAIAGLAAWETYAVWRAERRTPEILAVWLDKPRPLALSDLSQEQKDILLKVEDPSFYTHHGVDFGSPGQGMTTITQGLVKFLYFDPFRPGFAKIEQSLIAWAVLDRHLSKDEQLALFVNQAYLGQRDGAPVRGFAAGAEAYFGKPFGALDRDEFIGLVAMLIGPNTIRPDNRNAFEDRVGRIKAMLAGRCAPEGLLDATYTACSASS